MMYDAKKMSDAIRNKRKSLKSDGVENMVDTAPGPQMNPNDIAELKQDAQIEATLGSSDPSEAPSDPQDPTIDDSQKLSALKTKMARISSIFAKLSK